MIIGTVKGDIVSTIHHPFYTGKRMLVVEKEDPAGKASGYIVAIDGGVGVGVGDRVLIVDEGTSARQIVGDPNAPVRSIIVGVIDHIEVEA
jgi:ethanolamine utilization protein EutN